MTYKEMRESLLRNGWKSDGDIANAEFFTKGKLTICEHNGDFGVAEEGSLRPHKPFFNSYDELAKYEKDFYTKKISALTKTLKEYVQEYEKVTGEKFNLTTIK